MIGKIKMVSFENFVQSKSSQLNIEHVCTVYVSFLDTKITYRSAFGIQVKFSSEDPISISNNNKYRITKFSEWIKCKSIRNVCFWLFFFFIFYFFIFFSIHLGCSFSVIQLLVFWICSRIQFFLVYLLSVFLLSHSKLNNMNALHMNQFRIQLWLFFDFLRWFFGFIWRNCCWFTVHA